MRNRALIIASLALVAFAGVTTAASATTITTTAGATVATGSGISGSLKVGTSATLSGGSAGNIVCTSSSFSGTISTNPMAGSVSGSLTALTFGNCTDTIPFVTVASVTTNVSVGSPKTATATYVGAASTFAVSGIVATVTFTDGKTCIYAPTTNPATAQHNSLTSPWNNEYAFNTIPLTKTGGTSFACPTNNVTWSSTYVAVSGGVGITIQP